MSCARCTRSSWARMLLASFVDKKFRLLTSLQGPNAPPASPAPDLLARAQVGLRVRQEGGFSRDAVLREHRPQRIMPHLGAELPPEVLADQGPRLAVLAARVCRVGA